MNFLRPFFNNVFTLLVLGTLTIALPRMSHAQTAAGNAQALSIGFNGADVSGTDDQLPSIDTFYSDTKEYYSSVGKSMPGVTRCHAYVSWDVAEEPAGSGSTTTAGSLVWLQNWLAAYQGHCQEALITFKWIVGVSCRYYTGCAQGTDVEAIPHPAEVGAALSAFLNAKWTGWSGTFAFTPWNEPNNAAASGDGFDNGDAIGARTAAEYYLSMRFYCTPAANCEIAAGDFASNATIGKTSSRTAPTTPLRYAPAGVTWTPSSTT
jgi:hypothetical protein